MILREVIQQFSGFRYMTEQLEICSAPGRRFLWESEWLDNRQEVEEQLQIIARLLEKLHTAEGRDWMENVCNKLMQVRDIQGTIRHLGTRNVLDDLELYELKYFALLAEEIRELMGKGNDLTLPPLNEVVDLLDPEANRIPHFYIYDAYSQELAALRAEWKLKKQKGADEAETERIYFKSVELEDRIREELSGKLVVWQRSLQEALQQIALLDIWIAKAKQAENLALVRPVLKERETNFRGLFHPQLQAILQKEGKQFQPVDLKLEPAVTLVTGANMVGKTVLLKTIALAQCLLQFGFYVPAEAEMVVVDEVMTSIGDDQDELNGLSSFAAEMLRINDVVRKIREGRRLLVLVDELARTTNPLEGQALVNGVVDFLNKRQVMAVVTTHYSGITTTGRRLKVKGFVEDKSTGEVTLKNINQWIDYSLEEVQEQEVPQEALRIATLLGVDEVLLAETKRFLERRDKGSDLDLKPIKNDN